MNVNKTKFIGAMIFITMLMDVVPFLGFIRIGSISMTNLHIPATLTAIVLGPGYGVLVGSVFGIISLMRAVSRESAVLDVLLQNPLISVLPRLFFPFIAGYVNLFLENHLPRKLQLLATSISSLAGSLSNSLMVIVALYMLYPRQFREVLHLTYPKDIPMSIVRTFGPNLLMEAVACMTICTLCVFALKRFTESDRHKKWRL